MQGFHDLKEWKHMPDHVIYGSGNIFPAKLPDQVVTHESYGQISLERHVALATGDLKGLEIRCISVFRF